MNGWHVVWAIVSVQLFFAVLPETDVWFSGRFFDEQFIAVGHPVAEAVRMAIWYATLAMFLGSLVALVIGAVGWYVADIPAKAWGFVALVYLLGPGIMVNGILKAYWGRARPAQIKAFNGDKEFTPPFELSDQCASNCSFVSGEVSGAAALAISMVVLARWLPRRAWRTGVQITAALLCAVVMILRVAAGRHFLSDVVFAVLFTLGIAVLVDRALQVLWPSKAITA